MSVKLDNPADLNGTNVSGTNGEKLGKVENVYLDNQTDQLEWAAVKTGMWSGHISLVPLVDAELRDGTLTLPYDKKQVEQAPHHDPGQELSIDDEKALFEHYGVAYEGDTVTAKPEERQPGQGTQNQGTQNQGVSGQAVSGQGTSHDDAREGRHDRDGEAGVVGHDTSGPTTDDAMTRSEEELRAGTRTVQSGTARLRKHVVTEQQSVTVPVSHEEVTLEREPITEANRGAATDGPSISDEEHEVTLHAEQPVVTTETVAKERVKLGKETVREQQQVSGEVRKEQIEMDEPQQDRRS